MEQSEKTIKFNKLVQSLLDTGTVKNYAEIIAALDWNKSIFSSVINGRKNVPNDIFKKFIEVYQVEEPTTHTEDLLLLKATVRVLSLELAQLRSMVTKQSSTGYILELQKEILSEAKRLKGV